MTTGSCLCGGVGFEAEGTPIRVSQCHCSRCRKARGGAHGTYMVLPIGGVRFLRGSDLVTTYKVPEAKYFKNAFCQRCGSPVPRLDEARGLALVPMGAFDDDPQVRPTMHIFVASKAPWEDILDELPQHAGAPPGS